MQSWAGTPPKKSTLGDHDVPALGDWLSGKRIALLITGGIAAIKTPLLARSLRKYGAELVAFLSSEASRYVTPEAMHWCCNQPAVTALSPQAEHLFDGAPFDAYLVAPATYNTINKVAQGIADGPVTATLATALGRMEQGRAKVLFAPTMHGDMNNAILRESIAKLTKMGVFFIPPRDDYGKHNLPDDEAAVMALARALSSSPLRNKGILVTGGPTPVPVDDVRRLTNKFTGRLGAEIALALYARGANVHFIQGQSSYAPPAVLPHEIVTSYEKYRVAIQNHLKTQEVKAAIFSAAVADYAPPQHQAGKTPSGQPEWQLTLTPTSKVIDEVAQAFPALTQVTFKYQENVTHEGLMAIAKKRVAQGTPLVVANRGEDRGPQGEQVAHLVSAAGEERFVGKRQIAQGIVAWLENNLSSGQATG